MQRRENAYDGTGHTKFDVRTAHRVYVRERVHLLAVPQPIH
jgi:hypothetical protein